MKHRDTIAEGRKIRNQIIANEKNIKAINENLCVIVEGKLSSEELIKLEFDSIRNLVDYSEKLALNGINVIEKL